MLRRECAGGRGGGFCLQKFKSRVGGRARARAIPEA